MPPPAPNTAKARTPTASVHGSVRSSASPAKDRTDVAFGASIGTRPLAPAEGRPPAAAVVRGRGRDERVQGRDDGEADRQMVLFAIDFVVESVRQRIGQANAAAGSLSPRLVQAHLEQLLPLDDERRLESEAWFVLVALAQRDVPAAQRRVEVDELIRGAVESAVAALEELGALAAGRTLAAETARLHALLGGM
ncbi:TetR family transcriptional regulator C-terminal domain-containing protein [Streptomyces sp. NPDC097610]|uniref:TetR family transcriptional regulator C-terminal domain-containing protein n=1 Tax=Streptomyces sp. NPDC097610 TaxID=3157227 RepID=UPI00333020F5